MFLTGLVHRGGFLTSTGLDTVKEPHVCHTEAHHGLTIVLPRPMLAKATWSSQVGSCSRRRSGMSCPAHNGLGYAELHNEAQNSLCVSGG